MLRLHQLLLGAVLLAIILRLGVAFGPLPLPLSNDDLAYERIALSLARGEGFRDPAFIYAAGEIYLDRPPLTPMILAGLYRVFGHPTPVPSLLFSLGGGLTVLATYWLALPVFGRRAALLAALLAATYPMLVLLSAYTLTENIAAPLTALGALGVLRIARGGSSFGVLVFTGLSLGVGILNRSDGLVLLVGGLLFLLLAGRGPWRSRLLQAAGLGFVAALVVLPWSLRNYLESRQVVLVDTVFFPAFYLGNNPDTLQALLWELDTGREGSVLTAAAEEPLRGLAGPARHSRGWELAWAYILGHPRETIQVTAFKFLLFWRAYPHPLDGATTLAVEALALLGLWSQRRSWRLWLPLVALVLAYAFAHSVASALPRNRLTMMPLVLVFSAAGLEAMVSWLGGWRHRQRIPAPSETDGI